MVPFAEIDGAKYYGFKIYGALEAGGARFDRDKVILDPHARGVFFLRHSAGKPHALQDPMMAKLRSGFYPPELRDQ